MCVLCFVPKYRINIKRQTQQKMGGTFSKKTWTRRVRSMRYAVNRYQIKNVDKNGNVTPSVANCFGRSTTTCQRNLNQIAIEVLQEENARLDTVYKNQTREYHQATRNMMSYVNDSKTQFSLKTKEDGQRLAKDPTFIAFVVRVKQMRNTQQIKQKVMQKTAARIATNTTTIGKFTEVENHYASEDDESIDMTEHMKLMMTVLNSQSTGTHGLAATDAERTSMRFDMALDRANANTLDVQAENDNAVSSEDMAAVIAMMFASSGPSKQSSTASHAGIIADAISDGDLGQDDDDILLTVTGGRTAAHAGVESGKKSIKHAASTSTADDSYGYY